MEVVINACQCQVKKVLGIEIMDNIPYYLESLIILSVVTVDSTPYGVLTSDM
jgi:hypothetical protein